MTVILLAGGTLLGQVTEPAMKLRFLEAKAGEKSAMLRISVESTEDTAVLLDRQKFSLLFYAGSKEYMLADLSEVGSFRYDPSKVGTSESEKVGLEKKISREYTFPVRRVPLFIRTGSNAAPELVEREQVKFDRAVIRFLGTKQSWDGDKIVVDSDCWSGVAEVLVEGAALKQLQEAVVIPMEPFTK